MHLSNTRYPSLANDTWNDMAFRFQSLCLSFCQGHSHSSSTQLRYTDCWDTGCRLSIKMSSYQFNMGIPYPGKTIFVLRWGPGFFSLQITAREKFSNVFAQILILTSFSIFCRGYPYNATEYAYLFAMMHETSCHDLFEPTLLVGPLAVLPPPHPSLVTRI